MKIKLDQRAKVLLLGAVVAIGGAAAWFLYGEELLYGPAAPVAATPPKPAAQPAKPAAVAAAPAAQPAKPAAAEAPKPAAEAPKPAAEAPKPAAEAPKPAAAPAPAPAPAAPVAAKPAAVVAVAAAPTPKPAIVPVAMPVKEEPKAEPEAAKPPALATETAAAEEQPKPKPEPRLIPVVLQGPAVPGPRYNDLVTAVIYRDARGVEELLAFGKWADKTDSRGVTPLMIAAELGEGAIAEALLKAGANPNHPGPGGDTALSLARERKDAGMIGLLQKHGAR